jgi:hypothetical protein
MDAALIKMSLQIFVLKKPVKRAGILKVAFAACTAACD